MASTAHCGNHCVNLVEADVVEGTDAKVFGWMFCGAMFFGMGGNFYRLILATDPMLQRHAAKMKRGPPPEYRLGLGIEIADDCIRIYRSFSDSLACDAWSSDEESDDALDAGVRDSGHRTEMRKRRQYKRRHEEYARAWGEFRQFWNCPIWDENPRADFGPHYCTSPECCQNYDADVAHRRGVQVARNLVWRSLPPKPSKGKWTKTGPALDWHLKAQGLMGGFLQKTFDYAFGKLLHKEMVNFDNDLAYMLETNWHEVLGTRCKRVASGLVGRATFTVILVLAFVLEPLRWPTRWWMRRSSPKRRVRAQRQGRPAPLCDLVWLEAAPHVRVLQYLSMVAAGAARRLKLLWGRAYSNYEATG